MALLVAPVANAADQPPLYELQMVMAADGLTIGMPVISHKQLNLALTDARGLLSAQADALALYIEDNRPSGNGTLMAIIIPGGLLYLAYRQGLVVNAESQLTDVQGDLVEIRYDVIALYEVVDKKIVVARYP